MGLFATWQYDGAWIHVAPDSEPSGTEPCLWLGIHDSDFVTVKYRPVGSGTGIAFLGFTPRTYFEDEEASPPTDTARESLGLAQWWTVNRAPAVDLDTKAAELQVFLAEDLDPDAFEEDLDEDDIFVERKAERFLQALGLPLPPDLDEADH
jgi:hypothetical protein